MNRKKELRKEKRIPFESFIFYSTEHQLYEGEIKNYSTSGLFVKTSEKHSVGQTLNFMLPYCNSKKCKAIRCGYLAKHRRHWIRIKCSR